MVQDRGVVLLNSAVPSAKHTMCQSMRNLSEPIRHSCLNDTSDNRIKFLIFGGSRTSKAKSAGSRCHSSAETADSTCWGKGAESRPERSSSASSEERRESAGSREHNSSGRRLAIYNLFLCFDHWLSYCSTSLAETTADSVSGSPCPGLRGTAIMREFHTEVHAVSRLTNSAVGSLCRNARSTASASGCARPGITGQCSRTSPCEARLRQQSRPGAFRSRQQARSKLLNPAHRRNASALIRRRPLKRPPIFRPTRAHCLFDR